MSLKYKQHGSTLITALIMLIVLTLLVVSAIRSSNTNLRIAGNMQMQEEAVAAAQQALENVVSFSSNFSSAAAPGVVNVDINNDGVTDYTVNIAAPTCRSSTPSSDPQCRPICDEIGNCGPPLCSSQQWEVIASAVSTSTGATTTVHQGMSLTAPVGQPCPFTPE